MCAKKAADRLLSSLGEFGLIERIRRQIRTSNAVLQGIGDDAAVLSAPKGKKLLFSTDMLIEGVHFTRKMRPEDIGRKALGCSISDIAAMGGIPKSVLISLGVSKKEKIDFIMCLYKGMSSLSKKHKVDIVGGDVVKSNKLVINVAILGEAKGEKIVFRSGAKKGDRIFVTGRLGLSYESGRHLTFVPRVQEAQYLIKNFKPTSMIDISDGLANDLGHILEESKVGAILYKKQIPLNKNANIQNALYDGEDFELLFTLNKKDAENLQKYRRNKFQFFQIGEITAERNIAKLKDKNGKLENMKKKGYTHF